LENIVQYCTTFGTTVTTRSDFLAKNASKSIWRLGSIQACKGSLQNPLAGFKGATLRQGKTGKGRDEGEKGRRDHALPTIPGSATGHR